VTSYQMLDPTEGVPHSRVGKSFLRRNLTTDLDVNTIHSDDRQELRIDVSTYRLIFTYHGVPGRPFVYEKKSSKEEAERADTSLKKARDKREEKMREKFIKGAAWMAEDQPVGAIERRKNAWQRGLDEGLWKMGEFLTASPASSVAAGPGGNAGAS
jgi:paired amphipathic helix protein Sin3a